VHQYTAGKGRYISMQLGRASASIHSWKGQVHQYKIIIKEFIISDFTNITLHGTCVSEYTNISQTLTARNVYSCLYCIVVA